MRRKVTCQFAECEDAPVEWMFVPFMTVRGGLYAAYCAVHADTARSNGAVSNVVCDYVPHLPTAPLRSRRAKGKGRKRK